MSRPQAATNQGSGIATARQCGLAMTGCSIAPFNFPNQRIGDNALHLVGTADGASPENKKAPFARRLGR